MWQSLCWSDAIIWAYDNLACLLWVSSGGLVQIGNGRLRILEHMHVFIPILLGLPYTQRDGILWIGRWIHCLQWIEDSGMLTYLHLSNIPPWRYTLLRTETHLPPAGLAKFDTSGLNSRQINWYPMPGTSLCCWARHVWTKQNESQYFIFNVDYNFFQWHLREYNCCLFGILCNQLSEPGPSGYISFCRVCRQVGAACTAWKARPASCLRLASSSHARSRGASVFRCGTVTTTSMYTYSHVLIWVDQGKPHTQTRET